MEKMIYKRLYIKWIADRLERLEMLVESKLNYIPIYEEILKQKHDEQLRSLKVFLNQKLEQSRFESLSKEERISELKNQKIEKLEKAFYWKIRRINQSLKVAYASNSEEILIKEKAKAEFELSQIEQKKKDQLSSFVSGLTDQKLKLSKKISKEEYVSHQNKNESDLKDKEIFYQKMRVEKVDRLRQKTEKHVLLLNQKIEKLRNILSLYDQQLEQIEKNHLEQLKLSLKEDPSKQIEVDYLESKSKIRDQNQAIHLSISHLTMTFAGLKAVDDLSFDVKKGSIFGLIGPNGAGKTTVFNCITQFYKPKSGHLYFRNNKNEVINLLDYPVHNIIKQGIVRTFQNVELIWELNILDNMLVGAHSLYKSGFFTQLLHLPKLKREEEVIRKKAIQILTDLGLIQYKDFYPLGLPYGILKKIELARTLMTDPKLIILDEPAAGLNDFETKGLAKTIREINKNYGCTIFLVEHDMELVMDICDEICAISFGKKLAIGSPKEIQNHPLVREAYLGGE